MTALKVDAIKNGTVIDHIPAGKAIKLITLLGLDDGEKTITIGRYFKSKKTERKDIVKIEDKELTPHEVNQVYLVAPEATINIIRNSTITKKFTVELPTLFENIVICPNAKCISNHEICTTKFYPKKNGKESRLYCHYCEKIFSSEEINKSLK
ncbi:MAG: aspartate carbamoyltransferase regulatory subunit [bacterium]|nr:aspartate carbamoyltransferase regulatory subunit [bacterium]